MTTRREANSALLAGALLAMMPGSMMGAEERMELPLPRDEGGKPLMQALKARRSMREFADRPLPAQVLSDLLWAAFGVNRPQSGDRTAPSWRRAIEIEIYVVMADGVWRFVPQGHSLVPHARGDLRAKTGVQSFAAAAPVNLVYVADGSRLHNASAEEQRLWAYTDTGFIGQNVYLFCASEGLATVFRASLDREALAHALQLRPGQFVTCSQTVGYPRAG
jgi:nitroreductase